MSTPTILIAVAWPYVNGDLHIGHLAGYLLPSDIVARYHRLRGSRVLMVSGSDCYGTPITVEADKRGVKPADIVQEYHAKDLQLFAKLGISYDLYTTTTTANHTRVTQDIFLKCLEKGVIFKDTTDQYYDPVNNKFLPDRYVEGICPFCGDKQARSDQCDVCGNVLEQGQLIEPKSKLSSVPVELKPTEHYFFDWTKLTAFLESYLPTNQGKWKDWVYAEANQWLKQGLKARAITRDLDWGVEIPTDRIPADQQIAGAENKRIYVWFEAVIGYLSASIEWAEQQGTPEVWRDWWYNPEAKHYYFMGKDNLIFHTLFWPGQLHTYDEKLKLPDVEAINQFLTLEGKKFSKSKGVIVDSDYITSTYGVDSVRFCLGLIFPEFADGNFSWNDYIHKHNDILIGKVGNYINRVLTLGIDVDVSTVKLDQKIIDQAHTLVTAAAVSMEKAVLKPYIETIVEVADLGNKYLSEEKPWLLKEHPERYAEIIATALYLLLLVLVLAQPVMPGSVATILQFMNVKLEEWQPDLASQVMTQLRRVKLTTKPQPLFARIDEAMIAAETAKIHQ